MVTNSGCLVVIAEFTISKENREEFLVACGEDANGSVKNEPGCRAFDVLTSTESPDLVVLHEIYDDEKAFAAHREMPHFAVFAKAVEKLGATRTQLRLFTQR